MSGGSQRFLGNNKYFGELLMCLAQGHNTVPLLESNLGPLDLESDAYQYMAITLPSLNKDAIVISSLA